MRRTQPLRSTNKFDGLAPVCLAAALCFAGPAAAQTSPYFVGVSQSVGYDSNLLRLGDGGTVPNGYSRADTTYTSSLLAGLDQGFGRQRLRGNLDLRSNRFANNDAFNNVSYGVQLALDWATVERLSGTLSAGAQRRLSSFNLQEVGLLREKNLEDSRNLDLTANLGVVTQYSLTASASTRDSRNSLDQPSVQARNFEQDSGSLGVQWRPTDLVSLGLAWRETRGRYPRFALVNGAYEADRFKRNDIDLTGTWRASGISALQARISSGKTDYDLASQRNFSGLTGSLNWSWQATGKISTNTTLSRDTGQDSYAVSVFGTPTTAEYSRVNTALRLGVAYTVSAKISANLGLGTQRRELVRTRPTLTNTGVNTATDSGRESVNNFSLGARWAPTRSAQLGCDTSYEKRSGAASLSNSLSATTFSCYGQFTLQ
jgi:hypothetical protein